MVSCTSKFGMDVMTKRPRYMQVCVPLSLERKNHFSPRETTTLKARQWTSWPLAMLVDSLRLVGCVLVPRNIGYWRWRMNGCGRDCGKDSYPLRRRKFRPHVLLLLAPLAKLACHRHWPHKFPLTCSLLMTVRFLADLAVPGASSDQQALPPGHTDPLQADLIPNLMD